MTGTNHQLSVVVPVKNEEDNVRGLINEINAIVGPRAEIIFVDDGSTDGTLHRLIQLREEFKNLRVIHLAENCGQSTALRCGVMAARHDCVVTLDGDGQNDPADIPKLLAAFVPGIALVCGNRRMSRKDNWIRRSTSVIANEVRKRILGDDTPDTGCGLKIFSRSTFAELPYFDHMHRFIPALVKRAGGKIASVHVSHRDRTAGKSKYGTWDRLLVGVTDLAGVFWLLQRARLPKMKEF